METMSKLSVGSFEVDVDASAVVLEDRTSVNYFPPTKAEPNPSLVLFFPEVTDEQGKIIRPMEQFTIYGSSAIAKLGSFCKEVCTEKTTGRK
jgi:hypothetical protein